MDKPSREPYTIQIFLPQGTPTGLKVISRSRGSGRCLAFPWTTFPNIKKKSEEFGFTGVYVLVGLSVDTDSDIPHIYIGRGRPDRGLMIAAHDLACDHAPISNEGI